MNPSRTTLDDIARLAGVHKSTVSRALKNSHRVAPTTREKIKRLAEEHHFTPDPYLGVLNEYRKTKRPQTYRESIAWLTQFPTAGQWKSSHFISEFHAAIVQRAGELGYVVDHVWHDTANMSGTRISQILKSRNIRGVVIAPLLDQIDYMELEWDSFSAVTFGHTLRRPILHRVTDNQYTTMRTALQKMEERGYQRIGFVTSDNHLQRVNDAFAAVYAFWQAQRGHTDLVIPLILQQPDATFSLQTPENARRFEAYLQEKQLDGLIISNAEACRWLESLGYTWPRDLGVVTLARSSDDTSKIAGAEESFRFVASRAVDILSAMLTNGEVGIPSHPIHSQVSTHWIEGDSY